MGGLGIERLGDIGNCVFRYCMFWVGDSCTGGMGDWRIWSWRYEQESEAFFLKWHLAKKILSKAALKDCDSDKTKTTTISQKKLLFVIYLFYYKLTSD